MLDHLDVSLQFRGGGGDGAPRGELNRKSSHVGRGEDVVRVVLALRGLQKGVRPSARKVLSIQSAAGSNHMGDTAKQNHYHAQSVGREYQGKHQ